MNKNIKVIFSVFFVALLVFQTGLLKAQLSGTEAYVLGTGVQYGISGKGGYEGADTTLGAMFPGHIFVQIPSILVSLQTLNTITGALLMVTSSHPERLRMAGGFP